SKAPAAAQSATHFSHPPHPGPASRRSIRSDTRPIPRAQSAQPAWRSEQSWPVLRLGIAFAPETLGEIFSRRITEDRDDDALFERFGDLLRREQIRAGGDAHEQPLMPRQSQHGGMCIFGGN